MHPYWKTITKLGGHTIYGDIANLAGISSFLGGRASLAVPVAETSFVPSAGRLADNAGRSSIEWMQNLSIVKFGVYDGASA
jgi:hypothetical protein